MAKTGFTYYKAETDRYQDIKIKRLKKHFSCEGYAVYQYVLNEIYRVQGCWLEFGEDEIFEAADYWSIKEERVKEIINYCCEIGLFDNLLYRTKSILTARSIQSRYADMCKASKRKVIIPANYNLIPEEEQEPEPKSESPKQTTIQQTSGKTPETSGKNTENSDKTQINPPFIGNLPEKSDKEKKKKEKKNIPPSIPPTNGGKLEDAISLISLKPKNVDHNPVERNTDGLLNALERLRVPKDEIQELLLLSRMGEKGHPIWKLLYDIQNSKGRINLPGRFMLSRLKAS